MSHKIKPVVFLGPPGSGKGTQAKKIADENPGWVHISTGDLFRAEVKSGSPLGIRVKETMASGQLVSDSTTDEVFESQTLKIIHEKNPKVLILDGYPRTGPQAERLLKFCQKESVLDTPVTLEFHITEDEIVSRLSKRLVNPRTGRIYHEVTSPPKVAGICDVDGGPLERRADDEPKTIRFRYGIYVKERDSIVSGLQKGGAAQLQVQAAGNPEDIQRQIKTLLKI